MTTPLAYSVPDAAAAVGLSVREIQRAIADDELVARYAGKKRTKPLIARDELLSWFEALPTSRRAS